MAKTTVVVSILLVALLAAAPVLGQEPGMLRVVTIHVQLGHQRHFESLVPKVWEALKKAGGKTQSFVSAGVSDPGAYTFVTPFTSFADLDAQERAFQQAFSSVPEVTAEVFGITTSVDDEIWLDRPDLGYQPASQRVPPDSQTFIRMALLYAQPSQTPALEAVLKDIAALRKKHGIGDAVGVAQLVIGADGPAYAVLVGAKDEADFYTQFAKDVQKMGAEWQATLEKAGPMLRRVEYVSSSTRPALDYRP
jgi:hypothetical protein